MSGGSITLADVPDPSTYRPAVGTIPESPGVYRFRDPGGRVIYVGKAKSLRSRLNSYFGDLASLHPRTAQMVTKFRQSGGRAARGRAMSKRKKGKK